MRPEKNSQHLLKETQAKAKMLEYDVPDDEQPCITQNPCRLFTLTISLLGDFAASINRGQSASELFLELKQNLLFAARFFDFYIQSNLNEALKSYFSLMGAASYYLCDLPGSAAVLANNIKNDFLDLEGDGLENLLLGLLQTNLSTMPQSKGPFCSYIDEISKCFLQFLKEGKEEENLLASAKKLRKIIYESGTPKHLLFCDIILSIIIKKIENSTWKTLPLYSALPYEVWFNTLQKETFIRELWPAQHLLGKSDIFKGQSAIIQMPTSAGKTKAIELILRSAFLAKRVTLAIIIAPFRALCHEIRDSLFEAFYNEHVHIDELSDILQTDFKITSFLGHQQVLISTPEKLLYVLRHNPELASQVGLLFFDEGHQFDSGIRGVTYELLLTSLRLLVPEESQKILISAVMNNAKEIGNWIDGTSNIVEGSNLIPTIRSIGFTSWLEQVGKVEYVDTHDIEQKIFTIPHVIKKFTIKKRNGEYFFPENKSKSIAIYLGINLVKNGSVAIFCGIKQTVATICKKIACLIDDNIQTPLPVTFSDYDEVLRLYHLYVKNLGDEAVASKCAQHGIFSHHGNTPHGIRLSVEYAMRMNLVRFVICTSTLAQGINLPIRYLIVTSFQQGKESIKIRDFHNLIGRAGRSGMHTEGSILFANSEIYDKRTDFRGNKLWQQVKKLLSPTSLEDCSSNILSIFSPLMSDDNKYKVSGDMISLIKLYISEDIYAWAKKFVEEHSDKNFSLKGLNEQIYLKLKYIYAIESFLLSYWDKIENDFENQVNYLAESTLAFSLANQQQKEHIYNLFKLLAENISATITDSSRCKIYSRTLYGVHDSHTIEKWVQENINSLLSIKNEIEFIDTVWPLFIDFIDNGVFVKIDNYEILKSIVFEWICGKSFRELLQIVHKQNIKMIWGSCRRNIEIEHIVDLCERSIGYDGSLVVSAICEFILSLTQDNEEQLYRLQFLQKRLKYGLPTETSILLYEIGFSDRVIAQDIACTLSLVSTQKDELLVELREKKKEATEIINNYPTYFQEKMAEILWR